jgi:Secretion system C-terminal sorting domain
MKRLLLFFALLVYLTNTLYAQKDTVVVPGYYETNTYGTLNNSITAAVSGGTINNTVFKLNPYEVYVLSSSIFMDKGQNLEIVAPKPGTDQNSAPPQIVWTEEAITRDYIIQSYSDVVMKNIWVRYADFLGAKVSSSITFENQDEADDPEKGTFDGCIFDYDGIGSEAGGTITVKADHFVGKFENCYFRNNSDDHFQYYGRAVSFPYQSTGWHNDSLFFENCTFTNISRIVMQEGNEWSSNIQLNHCTILNTVEWVIQQSWFEHLSVTNSIIVNPYMLGYRALDQYKPGQTYDDFLNGLTNPPGGALFQDPGLVDSLGFSVPFTDSDRKIFVGNDAYLYTSAMLNWYTDCGWCQQEHKNRLDEELHHPYPMVGKNGLKYIDSLGTDGKKVFKTMNIDSSTIYSDDPGFIVSATNQDTMLMFIEFKWSTAADINWSYAPWAGFSQTWPLPENLAYTNAQYQTAAMGGFPLGDLNWFPDKMASWEAQRDAEWTTINNWLDYGAANPTGVIEAQGAKPVNYVLKQNYPNPFNPTTNIAYSIPKSGQVSLKVFNLLGQEVVTLHNGYQQAGNYTTSFDASGLASGVYLYRLQSGNVSISKKFVLMK